MARVYQASMTAEAHVRVALVAHCGGADLGVFRVDRPDLAKGDEIWFLTREKEHASVSICLTSIGAAELTVCFVGNRGEAGWQHPHRLKGRLG